MIETEEMRGQRRGEEREGRPMVEVTPVLFQFLVIERGEIYDRLKSKLKE